MSQATIAAISGLVPTIFMTRVRLAGRRNCVFDDEAGMPFTSMKLKPESGANRIKSADDAYSFVAHMRLSYRSKPHWQVARQALDNVCASDVGEIRAWRTFRAALSAENWLSD
jgi:hypothetical protein